MSTGARRAKIDRTKYRPNERLYIALEDLDFAWFSYEVENVKELWRQGKSVFQISKVLERDVDEVTILIMSLARDRNIKQRPGGIRGISA